MTEEILAQGLVYASGLKPKTERDPRLDSPLASIGHPVGWQTVVGILYKGYTFDETAEHLGKAWPGVLAELTEQRKQKSKASVDSEQKPLSGICTGPALRHKLMEVARDRHRQATEKLQGELSPEEQKEQRGILDEAEILMRRFGWSQAPTPAPEKKAATKRKSDKGKNGDEVADGAVGTDQPNGTTTAKLAPKDKARLGEPASVPTPPPTETLVPHAEPRPPGVGVGKTAANGRPPVEPPAHEREPEKVESAAAKPEVKGGGKAGAGGPTPGVKAVSPVPQAGGGNGKTAVVAEKEQCGYQHEQLQGAQAGEVKADSGDPGASIPVPVPPTAETPVPQAELKPPGSEGAKQENSEKAVVKAEAKQLCPDCQSPMKLRTAGSGKNKGKKFFGCSKYPSCKGTRSLDGQATSTTTPKAP